MDVLDADTIFYRHDHPRGYEFAAGNPAPDPAAGWVTSPDLIGPPPATTFECTTFEAYEGLVQSERANSAQYRSALSEMRVRNEALTAEVMRLTSLLRRATTTQTQAGEG